MGEAGMTKKYVRLAVVGVMTGMAMGFIPGEAIANTVNHYGGDAIAKEANNIRDLLFGPAMRLAGVIGGGYGLIQSVITSNIKPMIMYGGIGLGANILPKFMDSVFASGMLISQF
jgi:hypothetical protein